MSSYKSKFHKSLVCTFSEISIRSNKNDWRSTTNAKALKGTKANDDAQCIEKSGKKILRSRKSRNCTVSILAGCGCQSGRGIVLDRISADSHMPEVLSFQSIPSCSSTLESKGEKCPEWISSASFDEMLKLSSSSTYHARQEVHESFIEKKPKKLHISPVKFNDLVNKLRRSEQISTTIVPSADADQKFDGNFLVSPNSSSLHRPQGQNINGSPATLANKLVQGKVEESLIPKRKDGMADSLLIMKSSCDPHREFKESMMEMIVENKIKDGKDMEELLACFLYLNSEDYHDVIIQVFKQLWTELIHV